MAPSGPRAFRLWNHSISPDECDCARWSFALCGATDRSETCSAACCGLASKLPPPTRASLLCTPFRYAKSKRGTAAVTVFAMRHDARSNSTILYYALDNVSSGVHGLWSDANLATRSTRPPERTSDLLPPAHIKASDGSHVTSLPEIRACGRLARRLRRPRCLVSISLMCRLRFIQSDPACPVQLTWPGMGLDVSADLCRPSGDLLPRVLVAVSAPVFVPPSTGAASATLGLLADWVPRIARQVGRVYVHALNEGSRVRDALQASAPELVARQRAHSVPWNWYEAAGLALRPDSHSIRPASTAERRGRRYDDSSGELGMNPYHTQMWVLTKSLIELQDVAEWLLLVDIDEFWPGRLLNNRVPSTVQQVLQRVPAFVQQHPFCAMDSCTGGHVTWRPKSALRIGAGTCEWWGHPHAGVAVDSPGFSQTDWCQPRDDYGSPVNVFSTAGHQLWANFTARCKAGGRLGMPSGQYFEHRRLHAGAAPPRCELETSWAPARTQTAASSAEE